MFDILDKDNERVYVLSSENITRVMKSFEEDAVKFLAGDSRDMIVDLKKQRYINSSAIAVLFRIKTRMVSEGRNLKLVNGNRVVEECIEISGLHDFFYK